jgi:anti-sigma B factor antagonist
MEDVVLEIDRTDQVRGFRLSGELDLSNVPQFDQDLEPELVRGGDITLDLSELRFLDSSGLRAVIRAALSLEGRGRLVLAAPSEGVQRVLALAGLERLSSLVVQPDTTDGRAAAS